MVCGIKYTTHPCISATKTSTRINKTAVRTQWHWKLEERSKILSQITQGGFQNRDFLLEINEKPAGATRAFICILIHSSLEGQSIRN